MQDPSFFGNVLCYNTFRNTVQTGNSKGGLKMKKEVLDFVVEKSKELMTAPTCSQEARDAAVEAILSKKAEML